MVYDANTKQFSFDNERARESVLYLTEEASLSKEDLYKILFTADRIHLLKYFRFITGDTYEIDAKGRIIPRGVKRMLSCSQYKNIFATEHGEVRGYRKAFTDYLSKSDIECLDAALIEVRKNPKKTLKAGFILTVDDIASSIAGGEEVIKYLHTMYD